MPSDDAYQAVLDELAKLVEAWRIHREVVNRAISLLNKEVIEFQSRLDKDDRARVVRQTELDTKLQSLIDGQARGQRQRTTRAYIEILILLLIVAYLIGRNLS